MPLLCRKPFLPAEPPSNLQASTHVFFLPLTGEVFLDYECVSSPLHECPPCSDFFERTIQLNSMVWSCAATGKSGLTFEEALESEKHAQDSLDSFPSFLETPILYLVHHLCHRGRLDDLVNDIYLFMRDRYFVGEELYFMEGRKRHVARVMKVVYVGTDETGGDEKKHASSAGAHARGGEMHMVPADAMRYNLQLLDGFDKRGPGRTIVDDGIREGVGVQGLSRAKATSSRAKLKLFVKSACELTSDHWTVKSPLQRDFLLAAIEWEQVFGGPRPEFPRSPLLRRSGVSGGAPTPKSEDPATPPKTMQANASESESKRKKKNADSAKRNKNKKLAKILKQQEDLAVLFAQAEHVALGNLSRWKQTEKLLKDEDILQLKAAIKTARDEMRQRAKDEKRMKREHILEWRRPRDDLACDDLKPLPTYEKLTLPSWLSPSDFSRILALHQFFVCFAELLPIRDFISGGRVQLSDVMRAVFSQDARTSPFLDLIAILMQARAARGDEEDGDEADLDNREEIPYENCDLDHRVYGSRVRRVTQEHERVRLVFGVSARHLPVTRATLSEVMRLQLTTAGYYTGLTTARFRHFNRGGFRAWDDEGFLLAIGQPHIAERLLKETVWDLDSPDRLSLLQMLCDQLNTFFKFRQLHDARLNKLIEMRKELKNLYSWDAQQEKDAKEARLIREYELEQGEDAIAKDKESGATSREMLALKSQLSFVRDGGVLRRGGADLSQLLMDGVAYCELNLDEIVEARRLQRTYLEMNAQKLQKEIFDLQARAGLVHLGRDRSFRHYFYMENPPVILVESPTAIDEISTCDEPTPLPMLDGDDADDAPLSMAIASREAHCARLSACTGDVANCPVHGSTSRDSRSRFAIVKHQRQIDELIDACNPRGYRESELLENAQFLRPRLLALIEKMDDHEASLEKCLVIDEMDETRMKDSEFNEEIRAMILDLEAKIEDSGVGHLPIACESRAQWRRALQEEGDVSAVIAGAVCVMDEEVIAEGDLPALTPVRKLAVALLQLVRGVSIHFLSLPFVASEDDDKDVGPTETFLRWQKELLHCESLSALALFESTFESAILWSKSRLQAKCKACRRRGCSSEDLVLCASCHLCYHLACATPSVTGPVRDWQCSACRGERRVANAKTKIKPPPPVARNTREVTSEESSDIYDNGISGNDEPEPDSDENARRRVVTKTASGRVVKKVKYRDNGSASPPAKRGAYGMRRSQRCSDMRRATRSERENHYNEESDEDGDIASSSESDGDHDESRFARRMNGRDSGSPDSGTRRLLSMGLRDSGSSQDRLRQCEKIVLDATRQDFAWAFCDPVSKRDVPDYYKVIKRPMDLRTMLNKLKNRVYDSISEVVADVKLIVANCRRYNEDDSEISQLEEFMMQRLKAVGSVSNGWSPSLGSH